MATVDTEWDYVTYAPDGHRGGLSTTTRTTPTYQEADMGWGTGKGGSSGTGGGSGSNDGGNGKHSGGKDPGSSKPSPDTQQPSTGGKRKK